MTLTRTALVAVAGALLLAACSSSGGDTTAPTSESPSASIETASPGAVAEYVDNKSRCTSTWNYDTTANVQLKNTLQRVGVTEDWKSSTDDVVYLKQDGKYWPTDGGLSNEGEWKCKSVPWAISSDQSRVYDFNGGEWTGDGDSDFYWGHTQDVSGAPDEPNGWVKFACVGALKSGGQSDACPESSLKSFVQVEWDAENDDWTKLEKSPQCGFSSSSAIGCWETGAYGGQYEGQFNFNATAWNAPIRVQLATSAKDDAAKARPIVWEITKAVATGAVWPYGKSPQGAKLLPGANGGLVIGAYAMASNGYHGITLTLSPNYTLDDTGTGASTVAPTLANKPIVTVSVGLTLANVDGKSGPPVATLKATKDVCTVNPKSSGAKTYQCDVEFAGTPFAYGGAWSATIKTS